MSEKHSEARPPERLITIAHSLAAHNAHLLSTMLQQAGIEPVVADQHLVGMMWFLTGAMGGVKVQVWEHDLPAAIALLRELPSAFPALAPDSEPPAGDPQAEGVPPACPECGGQLVYFRGSEPEGFVIVLLEKLIPLPLLHGRWICEDCGKRWIE